MATNRVAVTGGIAALVAILSSCGYALIGKGSALPDTVRTVHVAPFVNSSGRVELDQRLAEATADEFVTRGALRVVADAGTADAILKATITGFGVNPVVFDAQGRATQYEIVVTTQVELIDRVAEKALWKDNQFTFRQPYVVDVSRTDYFDRETQAIAELALKFAQSLVTAVLEGF